MLYQITNIELDFDSNSDVDPLNKEDRESLLSEIMFSTWQADSETQLISEVNRAHGWPIKSINFNTLDK